MSAASSSEPYAYQWFIASIQSCSRHRVKCWARVASPKAGVGHLHPCRPAACESAYPRKASATMNTASRFFRAHLQFSFPCARNRPAGARPMVGEVDSLTCRQMRVARAKRRRARREVDIRCGMMAECRTDYGPRSPANENNPQAVDAARRDVSAAAGRLHAGQLGEEADAASAARTNAGNPRADPDQEASAR